MFLTTSIFAKKPSNLDQGKTVIVFPLKSGLIFKPHNCNYLLQLVVIDIQRTLVAHKNILSCTQLLCNYYTWGSFKNYVGKFWAFLPPLSLTCLHNKHFWTTYPPLLVNVVCERSLFLPRTFMIWQNNVFVPISLKYSIMY